MSTSPSDPGTTPKKARRFKRCPKCQAMLRPTAEFCSQCGANMPVGFPHNPRVPAQTVKAIRELAVVVPATRRIPVRPEGRYLVITARDRSDLFDYLKQKFSKEPGIQVVPERRLAERRRSGPAHPLDRRRRDRRTRPSVEAELRRFGLAIVNLD